MSKDTLNSNLSNKIIYLIKNNIKLLVTLLIVIAVILFGSIYYKNLYKSKVIKLSNNYTKSSILFKQNKIIESKILLEDIIKAEHKFYSVLALYFLIDNSVEPDSKKIITYFDQILDINSIDKESLNLIRIKKAIYILDKKKDDEQLIITTLNPVINSKSVWRNIAITLISDYFFSKDQKEKANEYIKLLNNTSVR
jgi:predicted negative regulator of RcsB-dependent stress response